MYCITATPSSTAWRKATLGLKTRRAPTPPLAGAVASGVGAVVDDSLLKWIRNSTPYSPTPAESGPNGGVCRGRERPRLGGLRPPSLRVGFQLRSGVAPAHSSR